MALAQLATMLVKLISVLSVLQLSLALPADNQVLAAAQHGQDSENALSASLDTSHLDQGFYVVGEPFGVVGADGHAVPLLAHDESDNSVAGPDVPKTRVRRVAPLVWAGVTVAARGLPYIIRGARLSQGQAVNMLRNGGNVITSNQRYAGQLAKNAWGKSNVIQHSAHNTHRSFMPHFQHQSSKFGGHSFFQG